MSGEGDTTGDAGAAADVQSGTSAEMAAMKASFVNIASDRGMFGNVPWAHEASGALALAASNMLDQLVNTGRTVRDISQSAGDVEVLVYDTDDAATAQLRLAQGAAVSDFQERFNEQNPYPIPPNV